MSYVQELLSSTKSYWAVIGSTCGEDEIVSLHESRDEAALHADHVAEVSEDYVSVRVAALV